MVSPYSVGVPGGVQGQVTGLAGALAAAGVDVEILAPTGPGPAPSEIGGVAVRPLGRAASVAVNGSRAPVSPFPWTAARALRRLHGGHYDVVHLHEPFVPGPTLAGLAFAAVPLVGTFHRAGSDVAYRALGRALGGLRRRLGATVAVSASARDTAAEVTGIPAGAFELLWNGVDVERFAGALPSPAERPTVLFSGRHEPRKGLAVLLEAFSGLEVEADLWICGAGPQTASLRARHAGDARLRWLGRVDDAELASRLAGATVYCSPAIGGESFGLVLAEAMAAGTPVVASDLPGYREALAGAGVLVPPGEAAPLAAALREVLASRARRSELVTAGQARAAELSIRSLAGRYVEIYEALCRR
jgi:phosphatidylinositol alpha-mannosyltransferase